MKPWARGVVGVVVLLVVGLLIAVWWWAGRAGSSDATDPVVAERSQPRAPPTASVAPPSGGAEELAGSDVVGDTDAPVVNGPGSNPSIPNPPLRTPEHVTAEEFDRVVDAAMDSCGMKDWDEAYRGCEGDRCSVVLAMEPSEGAPASADHLVKCPAWDEAWGPAADVTSAEVDCDDGRSLEVAVLSPATLRLQQAGMDGEGDDSWRNLDVLRTRACGGF